MADLVAGDPRVVYVRPPHRMTIGAKRSLAAERATGEYLAHWDDDDWYAPDRLSTQVEVLRTSGCSVVGSTTLLYWDAAASRVWRYTYPFPDTGRGRTTPPCSSRGRSGRPARTPTSTAASTSAGSARSPTAPCASTTARSTPA